MIVLGALTGGTRAWIIIVAGLVIWTLAAGMTASYGQGRGYRFWPLFLSAWFLGFPLVLLAIAIGAGPDRDGR